MKNFEVKCSQLSFNTTSEIIIMNYAPINIILNI